MNTTPDRFIKCNRTAYGLAWIALLLGLTGLSGWVFGSFALRSLLSNGATMKFNTGMIIVLIAACLITINKSRSVACIFLWLAAVLCAAPVLEYILNINVGVDELIYKDHDTTALTDHPGRTSLITAANGLLICCGFWLALRGWSRTSQLIIVFSSLAVYSALLGHLFNASNYYDWGEYSGIAFHTAFSFLLLNISILLYQRDSGYLAVFFIRSSGRSTAQYLIGYLLFVLPIIIWLYFFLIHKNALPATSAIILMVIITTVICLPLVYTSLNKVSVIDSDLQRTNEELVASEARLRGLLQQATAGIMICNGPDLLIESVNDTMLKIIGKTQQIIGKPFKSILPELEEQGLFQVLDSVYFTGKTFMANEAKVGVERNGQLIEGYFNFSYQAVKDVTGETTGILVAATDVTVQAEAKRRLKIAEEMLRSSIEAADIGTYAINASTRTLIANGRLKELFGYYPDEEMPYDAAIIQITDEFRHEVVDKVEAAFNEGKPFQAEYTIIGFHDQRLRWVRSLGKFDEQAVEGEGYFSGAIIDITEMVEARKAVESLNHDLSASREELQFAIDAASLGTWDLNPATGEFKGNDLLKSWFGLPPEENISLSLATDVIAESDRENVIKAIRDAMVFPGSKYDVIYTINSAESVASRIVRAQGQARFNDQQQPVRFSGTLHDVTEQKADEQRKNDFIGMVSHELKTPLTSLTGIVQIANLKLKNNPDAFLSGAMEKANVQVKRMSNMINGFLNISRLESGKMQLVKQNFPLDELLKEVIREHELTATTHIIHTNICDHVLVDADRDKISSVISNILNNAVKYSPKGKNIYVTCELIRTNAKVSIRDEGPGIDAADKQHLFERYYRSESSKTQYISGFGIGLYLSAEIIERHEGKIGVDSETGDGSTFWFELPLLNSN